MHILGTLGFGFLTGCAAGVDAALESELGVVFGERDRLLEVFQNLIENAVKFTGTQDSPQIRIGARAHGDETALYVRDNGIGIDPLHQDKIFDIFTQLEPEFPDGGIGLALIKRIVATHGGRIWVESRGSGTGAEFCFTIATQTPADAEAT